jgi:alkylhydroperoxidase family enzyme
MSRHSTADDRATRGAQFLTPPDPSPDAQFLYDDDLAELGFVTNSSRLWAHHPEASSGLFAQLEQAAQAASLTQRQRGILIAACASTCGDSYCSLAWGTKLAADAGPEVAAAVLRGDDGLLEPADRALAAWARQVAGDPSATVPADVQLLRDVGYDDAQILALTVFLALRIAFSTVNDALGAQPDHEFAMTAPAEVRAAVSFGRRIAQAVTSATRG